MTKHKKEIFVMGVLNVTPDSFFDGGEYSSVEKAVTQALAMELDGAKIIDVGGESSRPGAPAISVDEELNRVIPVIEGIRQKSDILISIDTCKPEVMSAAVKVGANIINDVHALTKPGALEMAVKLNVPVCLMHMQGRPDNMQNNPQYNDVADEVLAYLTSRAETCMAAGLRKEQIILDPGFGFGKTVEHNLNLLNRLPELVTQGYSVLVGLSRKSLLGKILDVPVADRLYGSLALASVAVMNGASIIRTHDVKETLHVVKVCAAILNAK